MEKKKGVLQKRDSADNQKKHLKDVLMFILGIISCLYLLNFSFGFLEFLPDALPFVGNLDEVFVTGLLISVLRYFNIDVTHLLNIK